MAEKLTWRNIRKLAREVEKRRMAASEGRASQRQLVDGYDYMGAMGEICLAQFLGKEFVFRDLPFGDDGIDNWTGDFTIDIKTATSRGHLLVEQGKVLADLYVAAFYDADKDVVEMLGWETAENVLVVQPKLWPLDIMNHALPCAGLGGKMETFPKKRIET